MGGVNGKAIHALGIDRCMSSGGKCEECEDLRNCPDGRMLMQQRRLRMQEDIDRLDRAIKGNEMEAKL